MTSAQRPVGQSGTLRTTKLCDKENDLLQSITLEDDVKKEAQNRPPDDFNTKGTSQKHLDSFLTILHL